MTKPTLRYCLFLLFIAACAVGVQAQSGRRKVPPPPAAPIPTPTPEPTPVSKEKVDNREQFGFVVGMDRGGALGNYPISFYDVVQSACAEGFAASQRRGLTWSEPTCTGARRLRAKSETTGNVVWLQLSNGGMNSTSQNYSDIQIEYIVYAPGTGKTVTSGRGYQGANRAGPIVVQPPIGTNNAMVREQLLSIAAEDVADRILKAVKHAATKAN